ncbi:MAG: transglutaminase-like domain-containing protein [Ruminococcus sp.]|nr:transglutaminase-like domain-containing protein [Ruminococcus sp.]
MTKNTNMLTDNPVLHYDEKTSYTLSLPKKLCWFLLSALLALLGFLGTMASALSLYTPDYSKAIVFLAAIIAFGLAILFQRIPHGGWGNVGVVLLTLCILIFAGGHTTAGIQFLVNSVYHTTQHTEIDYYTVDEAYVETSCVTLLFSCAAILLAFFFVYFTIRRPLFLIPTLISFLIIEPGLYCGIALTPMAAAPLLAYWCGMSALRLTLRRMTSPKVPVRNISSICGICTAMLVLVVYTLVVFTGWISDYTRSEADRLRKKSISNSLAAFDFNNLAESIRSFGSSVGLYRDTEISRLGKKSKLEFEDEDELILTFDTLPENMIYLKGFTGTVYEDNSWLASAEFSDATNAEMVSDIISSYDCAPQNYAFLFQQSLLADTNLISCTIISAGTNETDNSRCYQPYISYSEEASFQDDVNWSVADASSYTWMILEGSSVLATLNENPIVDFTFSVPENSDTVVEKFLRALGVDDSEVLLQTRFPSSQAALSPESITGKVIPAMLMESLVYRDYSNDAYTEQPDVDELQEVYDALPTSILEKANPSTAEEQVELLCEIRNWLAEETKYTTSPGKTPDTRDFVSFFVLENQKGYCVHYASAGTLLARYLGIPARYCEGFLITDDQYDEAEETEYGYTLSLTDRQSHAWTEIYIDGYGWIPFEMTPGYYDTEATAMESLFSDGETAQEESETEELEEEQAESADSEETTQPAQTSETDNPDEADQTEISDPDATTTAVTSTNDKAEKEQESFVFPTWLKWTISIILILAALVGIYVLLHKLILKRRQRVMQDLRDPKRAIMTSYHYLLRLLRFCGIPYHGSLLLDYQKQVASYLEEQELPMQAVLEVISITLAFDMGNHVPSPQRQAHAAVELHRLSKAIYGTRKLPMRILMKLMMLY